jgi:hypothetical protein
MKKALECGAVIERFEQVIGPAEPGDSACLAR